MFRKISQNSLGNTCSEVPSSIKLKTWSPKACHFTTQRTPLQVFSREFWEIFRLSCFWRKLTNDWFWRVHISDWLYQKQPPEMLYKKSYSWKFHNIHKKTPASEPLYDNIAGFVKKRLQQIFSSEYCEIFKNTYFEQHLRTAASLPERRSQDQWITEVQSTFLY